MYVGQGSRELLWRFCCGMGWLRMIGGGCDCGREPGLGYVLLLGMGKVGIVKPADRMRLLIGCGLRLGHSRYEGVGVNRGRNQNRQLVD